MQERWLEKNVDLNLLSKRLEDFFIMHGFKTRIDTLASGNAIVGVLDNKHDDLKEIIVKITGSPNDFVIEFPRGESRLSSMKFGLLTTFLGGGSLLIKSLKSQKALEKLEREFWVDVEKNVRDVTNSFKAISRLKKD